MKYILIYIFLFISTFAVCQFESNDFDSPSSLSIQIDSLTADTIWQIGVPSKTVLNETSSAPNALISDTLDTYPVNTSASFIIELNEEITQYFPYIQLEWFQKTDFEDGIDGGVIEASYDQGKTWLNIFNDTTFLPENVGNFTWDTLHNGQAGLTGVSELSWMAICWGNPSGEVPENVSNVQVRFTITSDSIDTAQDGWMIDDFVVYTQVIGNVSERIEFREIEISPNPIEDVMRYKIEEVVSEKALVAIYENSGRMIYSASEQISNMDYHEISIPNLKTGIYYLFVRTEDAIYRQKFVKIE